MVRLLPSSEVSDSDTLDSPGTVSVVSDLGMPVFTVSSPETVSVACGSCELFNS